METACWWLGILLGAFVLLRTTVFILGQRRLSNRFEELHAAYNARFGNTSAGRTFLDGVQPWHQRLSSGLGALAYLFGDWHTVVGSWVVKALAEVFSSKTSEQRDLEQKITTSAQIWLTNRQQFSTSLLTTTFTLVAIGIVTQTPLLPPPLGRSDITPNAHQEAMQRDLESPPHPSPTPSAVPPPQPTPPPSQIITAAEAGKIAVQRYPELGVSGSKLNTEFVARYKLYQQTRPDYFQDTSWPLRLAEECRRSVKVHQQRSK